MDGATGEEFQLQGVGTWWLQTAGTQQGLGLLKKQV